METEGILPVKLIAEKLSAMAVSSDVDHRMLGKYRMLETLGEGGFSKVKLGVVEGTGEKVALKILKKDKLSTSSSTRRQVEREIAAMAKIQHQNVIRLKEVDWDAVYTKKNGKQQAVILVVLELATGGELFEFLSFTGCFEEAIARTYFHQLVAGVAFCHSQGVVHRDLKPENLLLDDSFTLKLADFGFSNVFAATPGGERTMYTECGTRGYMAPEMVKNAGYEPTGADIWACGVILFIMLAGFPPFQKPEASDWWFQKLASGKHHLFWQAHSRNAYFSDATKDFINKILCPDPTKRITAADIRKHAWFNGPVIPPAALVAELSRRKAAVDEAKFREKLDKKRQLEAQQDAAQPDNANGNGQLGAPVDRDIAAGSGSGSGSDEDEGMPLAPPDFFYRRVQPQAQTFSLDSGSLGSLGSLGSGDLGGSADGADSGFGGGELKTSAGPGADGGSGSARAQVFDAQTRIACYTRFESALAPAPLLVRLARAFARLGQYSVNDEAYSIKAKLLTPTGMVTLTAQVFSLPPSATNSGSGLGSPAPVSVVEFRRRQGDSIQFRSLYMDLRASLADAVYIAPASLTFSAPAPLTLASGKLDPVSAAELDEVEPGTPTVA